MEKNIIEVKNIKTGEVLEFTKITKDKEILVHKLVTMLEPYRTAK